VRPGRRGEAAIAGGYIAEPARAPRLAERVAELRDPSRFQGWN
jgi:hypothetical protein